MNAWFACTGAELLMRDPADTVGRLASAQQLRGYPGSPDQEKSWRDQITSLRAALRQHDSAQWTVALEFDLVRLQRRIDAIILTDRAILCLEFKTTDRSPAALREAEDYALDLRDFHCGSRSHPIIPILVAGGEPAPAPPASLHLDCLWAAQLCSPAQLSVRIGAVQASIPAPRLPLDGPGWLTAPYKPVPHIVEAAKLLYARHDVREIAQAGADRPSLGRTTAAIERAIQRARRDGLRLVVFVTGVPGAGKTLCGLNAVFHPQQSELRCFLTGNVPLVSVLRQALTDDEMRRSKIARKDARDNTRAALQNVHKFLEDNATNRRAPEHVIVFDEAQRAWNQAKAIIGTRNKPSTLTMSEPAHTLDIMGRCEGWSVVVALIGNGQEINTGEAGLEEWGRVIPRFGWQAVAATRVIGAAEPAQRLSEAKPDWLHIDDGLDLHIPIRSVRNEQSAAWVDAMLTGQTALARQIAEAEPRFSFHLTRDLETMRAGLRGFARGQRRAGLVGSSGAVRLRAEGLGVQVGDTPSWFLNRWPDPRSSEALETFATEYDCQGLELDVVGLAWGGDMIRRDGWWFREFSGDHWNDVWNAENRIFVRNSYRVLLTRARYECIIWVPPGSRPGERFFDKTRSTEDMDAIADYLLACGVLPLAVQPPPTPIPEPTLLL